MTGTDKVKLASAVSASAKLADLRLWYSHCRYSDIAPATLPESLDQLTIKTTVGVSRSDDGFRYLIQFEVSPAGAAFFTIEARYATQFKISDAGSCSDEHASAFGELVVVHMLWPFFREFVTSMVARMMLPPVMLPLRQVAAAASQDDQPKLLDKRAKAKQKKRTAKAKRK